MYYDDSSKKWAFCLDGEYYDSTYNNLKIEFKKNQIDICIFNYKYNFI